MARQIEPGEVSQNLLNNVGRIFSAKLDYQRRNVERFLLSRDSFFVFMNKGARQRD
jgi:hypothetical protein